MAYNFIIEGKMMAQDVDAMKVAGVASADIAGGTIVELGAYSNGLYTITASTDSKDAYIALNPEDHFTQVGNMLVPGLSADPRNYTNLATRAVDVRRLAVGDTFAIVPATTIANIAVGDLLECANGVWAEVSSATTGATTVEVIAVGTQAFPQAGIGFDNAQKLVVRVQQVA